MKRKKMLLSATTFAFLVISVFVALFLVRQRQDLRQQASTGNGEFQPTISQNYQAALVCDASNSYSGCSGKIISSACTLASGSTGQCVSGFGSSNGCTCLAEEIYGCNLGQLAMPSVGCSGWVLGSNGSTCVQKQFSPGTIVTNKLFESQQVCQQQAPGLASNVVTNCGSGGLCRAQSACAGAGGTTINGSCADSQVCCSVGNSNVVNSACGIGGTCRTANLCNAANGTTIAGTCTSGYVCCKPRQTNASPSPSPTPYQTPSPSPVNIGTVFGCVTGRTAPAGGCENWVASTANGSLVCTNQRITSGQKVSANPKFRSFHSCEGNLAAGAAVAACPAASTPAFSASDLTSVPAFSYPAVIKTTGSPTQWLMFVGGLWSTLPQSNLAQAGGSAALQFPEAQESFWLKSTTDSSLKTWSSTMQPSFIIKPSTPVAFQQNKPYSEVYPNGFKTGCTGLTGGKCNVQINDASVVMLNGTMYLYFSVFENYRWFDGSLGSLANGNPTNPKEQNRHAIGLAVSADNGKTWAFVDKILPESGLIASNAKDGSTEQVLGAWAPSVVKIDEKNVDVYFHDALGTKQYVARLESGVAVKGVTRLNPNDSTYRVNLDVLPKSANMYEVTYNDTNLSIVRTFLRNGGTFDKACNTQTIVSGSPQNWWMTPHQYIGDDGKVHLFFWKFQDPKYIHHWVRNAYSTNRIQL